MNCNKKILLFGLVSFAGAIFAMEQSPDENAAQSYLELLPQELQNKLFYFITGSCLPAETVERLRVFNDSESPLYPAYRDLSSHVSHKDYWKNFILKNYELYPTIDSMISLLDRTEPGIQEAFKEVLAEGIIDINARDEKGLTLLMTAALSGNIDKVKLLLELNADTTVKNVAGSSVLGLLYTLSLDDYKARATAYLRERGFVITDPKNGLNGEIRMGYQDLAPFDTAIELSKLSKEQRDEADKNHETILHLLVEARLKNRN